MKTWERDCREISVCKHCSAPIRWVLWPKSGKRMPVDAEPVSNGTVLIAYSRSSNTLRAEVVGEGGVSTKRRLYNAHIHPTGDKTRG